MRIEILGCCGDRARDRRTTAYLINGHVLFDAGTVTEVLSPERLGKISHVCLSHINLDHVKGLCFLGEELALLGGHRVTVAGDRKVLDDLSKHVFNDALWPDFTAIPNGCEPVIEIQVMEPDGFTDIGCLRVRPVPVQHPISTTGFVIREGRKTVMMSSDTGLTDEFWRVAVSENDLKLVIAHVPFPNRLADLAASCGHMTLSVLLERIDTYALHHVPIYVTHMKSMFVEEITEEIRAAGRENLLVLEQGSELTI